MPETKIYILEDGKYTIECCGGSMKALRYGEPWRDLTGDKLIGALLDELDRIRDKAPLVVRSLLGA